MPLDIPAPPTVTSSPAAKPVEAKKSNLIDMFLSFEDGEVKLGGETLPGIFVSMTTNAGVKFDRAERDAMSGKAKVPMGWDDTEVKITLSLLCDQDEATEEISTCYDKLKIINKFFKNSEGPKKPHPKIYNIDNRHLQARGVTRLVFYGLQSDEDDQSDEIRAVLTFVEHVPAVVKRETAASPASPSAAPKTAKKDPPAAPSITKDTTNPFIAGFNAGYNF
ncbi:MAG: hypothetical protein PHC49_10530 [Desulfuromonadaceae bacterium]|nr:hypothetical protein [Desulfuromonadaceae bacterium]